MIGRMPQDDFAGLDELLQSDHPARGLDFLIARFREAKDYRSMFEARLMKTRRELGLPLLQTDMSGLPAPLGDRYRQAAADAAREVGERFLSDGHIADAWPYLRAT